MKPIIVILSAILLLGCKSKSDEITELVKATQTICADPVGLNVRMGTGIFALHSFEVTCAKIKEKHKM